jgi:hypothetical protein
MAKVSACGPTGSGLPWMIAMRLVIGFPHAAPQCNPGGCLCVRLG